MLYGLSLLVPILGWWCMTQIRGKIREQKGIEGTCVKDCLFAICYGCALTQEARVSGLITTTSKENISFCSFSD